MLVRASSAYFNAYQEELVSLEQLRERMPLLRQREQALRSELQAIADLATDRASFMRLAETLTAFLGRLRGAATRWMCWSASESCACW